VVSGPVHQSLFRNGVVRQKFAVPSTVGPMLGGRVRSNFAGGTVD
jgi:hypothetical protein